MKNILKYVLLISALLLSAGCVTQTRTVYVPVKIDTSKQAVDDKRAVNTTQNTVYVVREVPVVYDPPFVSWRIGVGFGGYRHHVHPRGPWRRW